MVGELCPHGHEISCAIRHAKDDSRVGQPICVECFDYEGVVIWNHFAGKLWHQTRIAIDRYLAKKLGMPVRIMLKYFASTEYVKIAEFQGRGLVHFRLPIRLDASAMIAGNLGQADLVAAIEHSHRTTTVATLHDQPIGWGA